MRVSSLFPCRRTLRAARAAAVAAALAATPLAARAQTGPLPKTPPDSARPFVLSISGGISLGAYMAGVNWTLAELFRRAEHDSTFRRSTRIPRHRLGAVAGASAGSINSLVWITEQCTDRSPGLPPDSSLFWTVWVETGLPQLFPDRLPPDSGDLAILDRGAVRGIHFPAIRARLSDGRLRECDVPVGLTLTRLRPDRLGEELQVQTQRFATMLHARTAGRAEDVPGGTPASRRVRFEAPDTALLNDPAFGKLRVLRPDSSRDTITTDAVFAAIEASSAFPLAFGPKVLRMYDPQRRTRADSVTQELVVDGGVFDNHPLGLALGLYRHTAPPTSTRALAVFINPDVLRGTLATRRGKEEVRSAPGGLGSAAQLLQGAIPTARQYELQSVARQDRDNGGRPYVLATTTRSYPLVSEHLAAFAGFLARPFREFDFYVGVYDGLHFLAGEYPCRRAEGGKTPVDSACVRDRMREWIERRHLRTDGAGTAVLRALFAREYAGDLAAGRTSLPAAPVPGTSVDSARVQLMLALVEAQSEQFQPLRRSCRGGTLGSRLLCGDGYRDMVQAFATDTARGIVRHWARREPESAAEARLREDARELQTWALDPQPRMASLLDRALYRLWTVENRVKREERGHRSQVNRETIAEAIMAVYHSGPLRHRSGFELNGSSVPRQAGAGILGVRSWDLLPYSATVGLGASGWEVGWRPMLHLSDRVAVVGHAVPLHRNAHPDSGGAHNYTGVAPESSTRDAPCSW